MAGLQGDPNAYRHRHAEPVHLALYIDDWARTVSKWAALIGARPVVTDFTDDGRKRARFPSGSYVTFDLIEAGLDVAIGDARLTLRVPDVEQSVAAVRKLGATVTRDQNSGDANIPARFANGVDVVVRKTRPQPIGQPMMGLPYVLDISVQDIKAAAPMWDAIMGIGGTMTSIETDSARQFEMRHYVAAGESHAIGLMRIPEKLHIKLDSLGSSHRWILKNRRLVGTFMRFLEQIDMVYVLGADLREPGKFDARFRITRHRHQGDFSQDDKHSCQQLIAHLKTAIRLAAELERAHCHRAACADAMDQLTMATVILDETSKVVHTNKLADLVFAQRDGISQWTRELILANDSDHAQFKEALARALRVHRRGEPSVPEILRVRRPSGLADFGMIIRPAGPNLPGQKCPMSSSVAVFLGADREQQSLPADSVRKLFGLTRAEAELTWRLAVGKTLAESAAELDISENTARTHLRAIFGKTGYERQTQLVRGVLKSVAVLGH